MSSLLGAIAVLATSLGAWVSSAVDVRASLLPTAFFKFTLPTVPPSICTDRGVCDPAPGGQGGYLTPWPNTSAATCVEDPFLGTQCIELMLKGECKANITPGADENGIACILTCGDCSPTYVSGRGTFSGQKADVIPGSGLMNASKFQTLVPRLPCQRYNVGAAVEAIRKALKDKDIGLAGAVRLGFHDAGDYDKWSGTGGPNGDVATSPEQYYGQSRGLNKQVAKSRALLAKLRAESATNGISMADLLQLASMVAVDVAGGPSIPSFSFEPGRIDNIDAFPPSLHSDGRLPNPHGTAVSLRDTFYRMGFDDEEIVALSGGHNVGGASGDKGSGFAEIDFTSDGNKFTNEYFVNLLANENETVSEEGVVNSTRLLQLPTDHALVEDKTLRPFVEKFAQNETLFFERYVKAIKKMSELGRDISVQWCKYSDD